MTYRLTTFYCQRCRTATPHEHDEENQRARCAICAEKKIRADQQARLKYSNDLESHIAALDGFANRGERRKQ